MKKKIKIQVIFGIILLILPMSLMFINFNENVLMMDDNQDKSLLKLSDMKMDNVTLRPNDDFLTEWTASPTPHWNLINDVSPDGIYLVYDFGDELKSEIFDIDTIDIGSEIVTKIEIYAFGYRSDSDAPNISINFGGWINNGDILNFTEELPDQWVYVAFDNLEGTNEDLVNLQIKITSGEYIGVSGFGRIDALYCKVFYMTIDIIITPENRIYNESMSGFYFATYGFESDNDGTSPSEWIIDATSTLGGTAQVLGELDGHKKVVELHDTVNGGGRDVRATKRFSSSATFGDIEFYLRTSDATKESTFEIWSYGSGAAFWGYIVGDNWTSSSGETISKAAGGFLESPQDNTWYHVRIAFETTTGMYEGLDQWQFKIWVDGVDSISLNFTKNYSPIDQIRIRTRGTLSGYYTYFDAVGYSWDPHYEIGDNLKEGLLLSFKERKDADWIGYSLDGGTNVTIKGNTTIPMITEIGTHTMQIFWSDAYRTYQSIIREFIIKTRLRSIVSPENKIYSPPLEGYYPATYGFEIDEDGDFPYGLVDESTGTCIVGIASEVDGHKKVIDYNDPTRYGHAVVSDYLANPITQGTMEFWIQSTDVTDLFVISLEDSSYNYVVALQLGDDIWQEGSAGWKIIPEINAPKDNYWHHVSIDFECTPGNYYGLSQYHCRFRIDNSISNDYLFNTNSSSIHRIVLRTSASRLNYHVYIDALGYSWDPNYNVGDNLKEGLLLSIQETDEADWMGYSLDGDDIITIQGNITLVMPADGPHAIQLFWNNTYGYYSTEVREFYVDIYTTTLDVEFIDQIFTTEEFLVKFSIKNSLGVDINSAIIDAWWNGVLVSEQVENLEEDGMYQISLTPITVPPGDPPILLSMVISAEGYQQKEIELSLSYTSAVIVEFVDHLYTSEAFLITFSVKSSLGADINSAIIDAWWNGVLVSEQVENLEEDGMYQISLTPITVIPGETPILLRMSVSAEGYPGKEIEIYLAVDPDVINKEPDEEINDILPLILTITVISVGIASAAVVLSIGLIRIRSKRLK